MTFVGLVLLGAITNKGVEQTDGSFYMRRSDSAPVEISQAEYQRQVAYVLWMFSAWSLWTATGVLALTTRPSEGE